MDVRIARAHSPSVFNAKKEASENMKLAFALSCALLPLSTVSAAFVVFSASSPTNSPTAAVPACVSVSCEGFFVVENGQMYQSCVNHGCSAGCSPGPSNSNEGGGGGWSACKCGGQVEPRCCHLIWKVFPELGYYHVASDGQCANENQSCPAGNDCAFWRLATTDGSYEEFGALCL